MVRKKVRPGLDSYQLMTRCIEIKQVPLTVADRIGAYRHHKTLTVSSAFRQAEFDMDMSGIPL